MSTNLNRYRRGLVRPLTAETLTEILDGTAVAPESVEHYAISDAIYERYFQLFNDLDRLCGVAGDNFETEEVELDRLPCVLKTLRTYNRRTEDGKLDTDLDILLDRAWGLCWRAQKSQLPVFFVL